MQAHKKLTEEPKTGLQERRCVPCQRGVSALEGMRWT